VPESDSGLRPGTICVSLAAQGPQRINTAFDY